MRKRMRDADRKGRQMANMARKIKDLRLLLGINQRELAEKIGLKSQGSVSKWERGKEIPDSTHTVRLAKLAGVGVHEWLDMPDIGETVMPRRRLRLVGSVQAGAWKEAIEDSEQRWVDTPLPAEFDNVDVQAFEVTGSSMNKIYPEGTVVYVASVHSYRAPEDEDRVLIIRRNEAGLYEATLKEYIVGEDGQKWLWPRSYDPQHQAPLEYIKGSDGEDITIKGIVVASLIVEAKRKPKR